MTQPDSKSIPINDKARIERVAVKKDSKSIEGILEKLFNDKLAAVWNTKDGKVELTQATAQLNRLLEEARIDELYKAHHQFEVNAKYVESRLTELKKDKQHE